MHHCQNWRTWNTRTIDTWARSFSFAEEVGNVCSQRNILNQRIQDKCIDMENVHDFVDESSHLPWARFSEEFWNLQEHKIREHWECVQHYSKVGNGTLCRNSECERPVTFITIMDEISVDQRPSRKNGDGKSLHLRRFRPVCQRILKTDEKVKLKISRWSQHVQMHWDFVEKQMNSSGKISQDFRHCLFCTRFSETWRRGTSNQRTSRTRSSSCQCSMTFFFGKRMMRIASLALKKSKITRQDSYQDIGRFWVQDRSRNPTSEGIVGSHRQQDDTEIQTIWSPCLQRLSTVELWSIGKRKPQSISMEILETRSHCFKLFVLSISSVSTEQWPIGSINLVWQMKKKGELISRWMIVLSPWWNQQK